MDGEGRSDAPAGRSAQRSAGHLVKVTLDEATIGRSTADVEHEWAVAIYDLIEDNVFHPEGAAGGAYALHVSMVDRKLVFDVAPAEGGGHVTHVLSLAPFRRVIRDYFLVCDSYYEAIRTATPSQIEAIDMGRRGLHNDGSTLLMERLSGKLVMDFDTARRLFTLICVLHRRG